MRVLLGKRYNLAKPLLSGKSGYCSAETSLGIYFRLKRLVLPWIICLSSSLNVQWLW